MEQNQPKKRGPKPKVQGEFLTRKQVTIDSLTIRKLKVLGRGNLSEGVRAAADAAYEHYQNTKD